MFRRAVISSIIITTHKFSTNLKESPTFNALIELWIQQKLICKYFFFSQKLFFCKQIVQILGYITWNRDAWNLRKITNQNSWDYNSVQMETNFFFDFLLRKSLNWNASDLEPSAITFYTTTTFRGCCRRLCSNFYFYSSFFLFIHQPS